MTIQCDDMAARRSQPGPARRTEGNAGMNASPLLPLDVASATFLLLTAAMAATTVLLLTGGHWVVAALASAGRAFRASSPLIGVLHYALSQLRLAAERTTCRSSSATSTG